MNSPVASLFNRELSWLSFNDRVLEEAQDANYPVLERLKFVAILSSNLDEFFMVRVAGLVRKIQKRPNSIEEDGQRTEDVLAQIREWVIRQKESQGHVLKELLEKLKASGVYLQTEVDPNDEALNQFAKSALKDIKIQKLGSIDEINTLPGGKIYIFVRLKESFAIIKWPDTFDRLMRVPENLTKFKHHFILAERLFVQNAQSFFPNDTVMEAFPFKAIRDADFFVDPNVDPDEYMDTVELALEQRAHMPVVRLEVDSRLLTDGALQMAQKFNLHARSIYRYDVPMDLKILWRLHELPEFESLKYKRAKPMTVKALDNVQDMVSLVRQTDVLLHHPYDTFETVEKLLEAAAKDESVLAIKQTLYRTGAGSPIAKSLIAAAQNGKKVTVYVELRARFDEAENIKLAKELRKNKVRVLKGFPDKKIHCKLTQILRKEGEEVRSYVHVGTGNYNTRTAKAYTDLGLITADPSFGRDAENIFRFIQKGEVLGRFESFVTAPAEMHRKIMEWIRHETQRAQGGDKSARIVAKMNALVEAKIVDALYKASQAGVKIDLIIRGACVLRPGIPGLSENIRVISIVDHYLEHSRIYYFHNGDSPLLYLSSADWMPRNLYNRIEVAFPVRDPGLQEFIRNQILEAYLKDNQKARMLKPDGQWARLAPQPGEAPFRAQDFFTELARTGYKGMGLFNRLHPKK